MAWSAGAILTAGQLNTYVPQAWSDWNPTITASSGTFTTVSSDGRYVKMGKTVIWSLRIDITTVGTAADFIVFALPVTAAVAADYVGSGKEITATGALLSVESTSTTSARIIRYDNASAIGAGRILLLGGAFEAATA